LTGCRIKHITKDGKEPLSIIPICREEKEACREGSVKPKGLKREGIL